MNPASDLGNVRVVDEVMLSFEPCWDFDGDLHSLLIPQKPELRNWFLLQTFVLHAWHESAFTWGTERLAGPTSNWPTSTSVNFTSCVAAETAALVCGLWPLVLPHRTTRSSWGRVLRWDSKWTSQRCQSNVLRTALTSRAVARGLTGAPYGVWPLYRSGTKHLLLWSLHTSQIHKCISDRSRISPEPW